MVSVVSRRRRRPRLVLAGPAGYVASFMNRPDLIRDPVAPTLLRLMVPMLAGAMGIVLFNVVDTFFVGRLGADELAAMSYTFPIVIVAGSIASGIGIGTSATVARALGARDDEEARRLTIHALIFGALLVTALAVVGLATIEPFFTMLGAAGIVLQHTRDYMVVWYVGMPFVVLPMVGQSVLQAVGDSRTPARVIVFAVLLNSVLDPLLIFGVGPFPELGIRGAAIATVISRSSTLAIVLWAVALRERMIPRAVQLARFGGSVRRIVFIGVPAALTNLALPISIAVVTRLVSRFGQEAVAGYGVATRLESFSLVFTFALSMVFTPFVGQNLGAGQLERARQGHRVASLMSIAWGAMVAVVFLAAAGPIARVFNDEAAVSGVTARYLRLLAPSFGLLGVVNVSAAAFSGLHEPFRAAGTAFFRLVALAIPFAILGRALGAMTGLFLGLAAANALGGIAGYLWVRRFITPELIAHHSGAQGGAVTGAAIAAPARRS